MTRIERGASCWTPSAFAAGAIKPKMIHAARQKQAYQIWMKMAALQEPKAWGCKAGTFVTRIHVARGAPSIEHSGERRATRMRTRQLRIHTHRWHTTP